MNTPNTINGRTPEEIKKGLECCKPKWKSDHWVTCRDECPFRNEHAFFKNVLMACTLALLCRFEFERDEARNDLDALNYANTELHSAYEAMKRERDAAMGALAAQPKWISVKERLPGIGVNVLTITCGVLSPISTGWYSPTRKSWCLDNGSTLRVTHWMPLPELPEDN